MPRRDPRTGKFVSGGDSAADDRITGSISTTVPAADLAGGIEEIGVDGERAEVIDFTSILDSDEIFEVAAMTTTVALSGPTTATAEGSLQLNWTVATDLSESRVINPVFFGKSVHRTQGVADIRQAQWDDDSVLTNGLLTATPSMRDTATGTAGGSHEGFDRERIGFWDEFGSGPVFDQDDELTAPHKLYCDGVDDHAIVATILVSLEGNVSEL